MRYKRGWSRQDYCDGSRNDSSNDLKAVDYVCWSVPDHSCIYGFYGFIVLLVFFIHSDTKKTPMTLQGSKNNQVLYFRNNSDYVTVAKSFSFFTINQMAKFLSSNGFISVSIHQEHQMMTLLRSPHANKNAREQFARDIYVLTCHFSGSKKQFEFFKNMFLTKFKTVQIAVRRKNEVVFFQDGTESLFFVVDPLYHKDVKVKPKERPTTYNQNLESAREYQHEVQKEIKETFAKEIKEAAIIRQQKEVELSKDVLKLKQEKKTSNYKKKRKAPHENSVLKKP